jgi:hypothetical protein
MVYGLCVVTYSRIIVIYKVGKFDYEYARWYRLCVLLPKSREKAKIAQERELREISSPNSALVLVVRS